MSLNDEVAMLAEIPLFADFEPSTLKLLAFASQRLAYVNGQEMFRQGDSPDCAYVIISGTADVIVEREQGAMVVATVGRHDIVGEIAIIADVPRTATVRATGELVVLQIEKEVFLRMMLDFPKVAVAVMRVLALRLHNTTSKLSDAGGENTESG